MLLDRPDSDDTSRAAASSEEMRCSAMPPAPNPPTSVEPAVAAAAGAGRTAGGGEGKGGPTGGDDRKLRSLRRSGELDGEVRSNLSILVFERAGVCVRDRFFDSG